MPERNGNRGQNSVADMETDLPATVVHAPRTGLADHLVAIVLYGSRARGDHRPDSDWDLLVIAEGLPEKWLERYQTLKRMIPLGVRGAAAILSATPTEFESHLPALYLDIGLDGRILYERDGYASERLAEIRRIITKAGLFRERTPAGDIWSWETPPTGRRSVDWER